MLSLPSSALTVQAAENDRYDVVSSDETGTVVTKSENGALTENAAGQLVSSDDTVVYDAGAWSVSTATNDSTGDTQTGSGTGDGTTDDTQAGDGTEPAADPQATANVLNAGNGFTDTTLVGATTGVPVEFNTTATHVTGIKVYDVTAVNEKPSTAKELKSGDDHSTAAGVTLYVAVKTEKGYEPEAKIKNKGTEDAGESLATPNDADTNVAAILSALGTDAGSWEIMTPDDSADGFWTAARTITVSAIPFTYDIADGNTDTVEILTVPTDDTEPAGLETLTYGTATTFALASTDAEHGEYDVITKVQYYIGKADDIPGDSAEDAEKAAFEAKKVDLTTWNAATSTGTISTAIIDKIEDAALLAGDSANDVGIFLFATITDPIPVDLPDSYTGVKEISTNDYPAFASYGKDLTYTWALVRGYETATATVKTFATEDDETGTAVANVDAVVDDVAGTVSLTIPWAKIKDAAKISVDVVGAKSAITIAYANKDSNIDATKLTTKTAISGLTEYSFELTPKTGYMFDATKIAAINAALAGLDQNVADDADVDGLTLYGIANGKTFRNAANSEIYRIQIVTTSETDYTKPLVAKVLGAVGSNTNTSINHSITINIPDGLTTSAKYAVTYDENTAGETGKITVDGILAEEEENYPTLAPYGKDFKFSLKLAPAEEDDQGNVTEDYILSAVTYTIGETTKELAIPNPKSGRVYDFTIPKADIVGAIAVEATVLSEKTASLKIAADTGITTAQLSNSITYAVGGGKQPYTLGSDTEITAKTGQKITITATTTDSFLLTKSAIETKNDGVLTNVNVSNSGNEFTITGIIAGGTTDTDTVTLAGVAANKLVVNVTDEEAGTPVKSSVKVAIKGIDNGAEYGDFVTWTAATTAKLAAGTTVKIAYIPTTNSNYKTSATVKVGTGNEGAATTEKSGDYLVIDEQTIAAAESENNNVINVTIKNELKTESTELYVYNADAAQLTNLKLTADTADLSTDAKLLAYQTDYLTNARSTKLGVVKDTTSGSSAENGYLVFPAVTGRATTTDTANLKFTVTVAANYELEIYNWDGEGTLATLYQGTPLVAGTAYTIDGKSNAKTITMKKDVPTNGTLVFHAKKATAAPIVFYGSGTQGDSGSYTVTAQIDGKKVAIEDDNTYDKFSATEKAYPSIVVAEVGQKVTLTLQAKDNNTITGVWTKDLETANATEKAVTSKTKDSFTVTVTAGAKAQGVRVDTATDYVFGKLQLAGETEVAPTSTKTAVNNTTEKHLTTYYTYNSLVPGVKYTIPKFKNGANDVAITAITPTGTIKDAYNATNNAKGTYFTVDSGAGEFQIGEGDKATTFKITVKWATNGAVADVYTVKAGGAITSLKVAGVSAKDTLTQEAGTVKTYNVTVNSGAFVSDLAATLTSDAAGEAAIEDGSSVTLSADKKTLTIDLRANVKESEPYYVTLASTTAGYSYQFKVWTTDSKVAGSTPGLTLKSATDKTLTVNLALPSTVSSTTFKSLAADALNTEEELVPGGALAWAIKVVEKGGDLTDESVVVDYVLVTGASQTAELDIDDFVEGFVDTETGLGKAADLDVEATLVHLAAYSVYGETALKAAVTEPNTIATSEATKKSFATKAPVWVSSLSLRGVTTKLYAGHMYLSNEKEVVYVNGTPSIILANVVPDSAATVLDWDDFEVEPVVSSAQEAIVERQLANLIQVIDGKLVVPVFYLAEEEPHYTFGELNLGAPTASLTLRVYAPQSDERTSQIVSADIKLTFTQRAIEGMYEVTPSDALTLAKKNGTALTTQLGITYNENLTKKSDNSFQYYLDATSFVGNEAISPVSNVSRYDDEKQTWIIAKGANVGANYGVTVDANTGKVTVGKDFVFPADETAVKFKVNAISKYNGTVYEQCEITLVQAEKQTAQGDIVVAAVRDGEYTLVAKKGDKLTYGDFYDKVPQDADVAVIMLTPNAVIAADGTIASAYVVSDTNLTITESTKEKIAQVLSQTVALNETDPANTTQAVELTGTAIGAVTFTAVAENTNAKKTVAITIVGEKLTSSKDAKEFLTLEVLTNEDMTDPVVASNSEWQTALDRTATVSFSTASSQIAVKVLKGEVALTNNKATGFTATGALKELDNYYEQQLKASTGVTISTDSEPAEGLYILNMYGKTGKVTLNGVTYTLTNERFANAISAGSISHTAVYANYAIAQEPVFTASNTKLSAYYAVISEDTASTATINVDGYDVPFFEILKEMTGNTTFRTATDERGRTTFTMPLDTTNVIFPTATSYTFYVAFTDEGGDFVSEPVKTTLRVSAAPAFTPITNITVPLSATEAASFTLQDRTGRTAKVMTVTNVNNKGVENSFTKLIATTQNDLADGIVALEDNETLLTVGANKANREGYVWYTADGGVTYKSAKVTLTFTASGSIVRAAAVAAITAAKDDWSAENVTAAKAATYLKSIVNLPSGYNLTVTNFGYDVAELKKTGTADTTAVKVTGQVNITKSGETIAPIILGDAEGAIAVVIPKQAVTVDIKTGAEKLTYTIKDGANATETVKESTDTTIHIANGATLTVNAVAKADGYANDVFKLTYGTFSKEVAARSGALATATAIGKIEAAGTLTITPENTITLTRGANVKNVILKNATTTLAETGTASSVKVNVPANTEVTVGVINVKGYDVALTDNKTPVTASAQDGEVATTSFTITGNLKAAHTFAATAKAHTYKVTINLENATGVYKNVPTYGAQKTPATLTTIPVDFGKTVAIQLILDDGKTIGAKTGDYVVTVKQGEDVLTARTASGQTSFTTKAATGDVTITVSAVQNAGIYVDNTKAPKASALQLGTTVGDKTTWKSASFNREIVVPEITGTTYSIKYTIAGSYKDQDDNYGTGTKEVTLTTGEKVTVELTTTKSTKIGTTDVTTAVYGGEAAADLVQNATYSYRDANGLLDSNSITDLEAGDELTLANGTKLTITADVVTGYTLSLLTWASPTAAPRAVAMKKTTDGTQWTADVTLSDSVAIIGFRPVAEARTFIIDATGYGSVLGTIAYTNGVTTTYTNASKTGKTTVRTYYNAPATVRFTPVVSGVELELTTEATSGALTIDADDTNTVAGQTYYYTVTPKTDAQTVTPGLASGS